MPSVTMDLEFVEIKFAFFLLPGFFCHVSAEGTVVPLTLRVALDLSLPRQLPKKACRNKQGSEGS